MKQLKKTILTLVALLALTTHAWAADPKVYSTSVSITDLKAGDILIEDAILTNSGSDIILSFKANYHKLEGSLIESISEFKSNSVSIGPNGKIKNMGFEYTPYDYDAQKDGNAWLVDSNGAQLYLKGITFSAAPTPVPLTWTEATKTASIAAMPAGNVTVSVEYYPQAALTEAPTAINDVPATTDGDIVKAGTVANIGSTTTAQGTVMYYVSTTALDDDALLALDADKWKADVPTAESLAEGQAYVYYYVRGNDSDTDEENFSDGDILAANALTVTIAAEPTYAITFADGVNPEPPAEPEWTASPNADVKKGQTVTVTYSGDRKVIGVKAEKKASTPTLKDALKDGATVVITYTWMGSTNVTTFTYTKNGDEYTGSTTGDDAEYFANGMSKDGTTLKFTASNPDVPEANVSIDFFTDTNEYSAVKGSLYTSLTISVNGTDITSQLTGVK